MKKALTVILAALLIGTFAGCGTASNNAQNDLSFVESSSASVEENNDEADEYSQVSSRQKGEKHSKSASGNIQTHQTSQQSETSVTVEDDVPEKIDETAESDSTSSYVSEPADETSAGNNSKTRDLSERSSPSHSSSAGSSETAAENGSDTSYQSTGEGYSLGSAEETSDSKSSSQNNNPDQETTVSVYTANTSGKLDTADLFSNRDLTQTPDISDAETIQAVSNKTVTITEAGTYILTGTASDFTVKVETDKESKVQLVLDNFNVTNSDFPVIYVVSADKCFITTLDNTSSLSVTGNFKADGDTNTDAVIFSKDDLVFNGTGTLKITSSSGNGISGKDDIKFTGGTYNITASKHGIEAHDSISACGGTFTIRAGKDGLHCENGDDDTVGWIYISDGTFSITASSDGIRGTTYTQIDGGNISISSSEGIESTYIQINGGNISISATDDGINASQKSKSTGTPVFEITGGSLNVTMSGGDVDCIDSNGNIIVSGGTISVTYPVQGPSESFDCDGTASYTGGTIIINGNQVNSIPQSMMGGRGMGNMGSRGGFGR